MHELTGVGDTDGDANDGLDDFGEELKVQDKRIEQLQQAADKLLRDLRLTKSQL